MVIIFLRTALVLLLCPLIDGQILNLTTQTLPLAKQQFKFLLIYFYDNHCQHCNTTNSLFFAFSALLRRQQEHFNQQNGVTLDDKSDTFSFPLQLKLGVIEASANNQAMKSEKVQHVPEFRLYSNYNSKYELFPMLFLAHDNLQILTLWIKRVTQQYFPVLETLESVDRGEYHHQKMVIVDCRFGQLIQKLKGSDGFLQHLEVGYACIRNSNLRAGNVMLKDQNFQFFITCEQSAENWRICENRIRNFRTRGLVRWSDEIVHTLYKENRSVIILITNNQSTSWEYLRNLTVIKRELDYRKDQDNLPIFAVADLLYDIEGTMRVKKFIGGYYIQGQPYPYPLLACLQQDENGYIIKYIFQQKYRESPVSNISMEEWIERARKGLLKRDLRGLGNPTEIDEIEEYRKIQKIYLSQLTILIERLGNETVGSETLIPALFVYVLWGYSYQMQLLAQKILRWWEIQKYNVSFVKLDVVENDLPANIKILNLPAIITYYSKGKFQVQYGLQNLQQVKQVIQQNLKDTKVTI